jgi:hypothetical protein
MSTTTNGSTYGSISNAPGWREENQQRNKVHTTANVSDGTTTTTTVAASYGAAATTVALNATVDAAETAIRTVRAARTKPTSTTTGLPSGKTTGTARRKETGAVASFGTRVNGTGYTDGTYTNVALSGGSGYGATATITVASGAVTAATLVRGGQWYTTSDTLSCALIGAGSNFALPVATTTQG